MFICTIFVNKDIGKCFFNLVKTIFAAPKFFKSFFFSYAGNRNNKAVLVQHQHKGNLCWGGIFLL